MYILYNFEKHWLRWSLLGGWGLGLLNLHVVICQQEVLFKPQLNKLNNRGAVESLRRKLHFIIFMLKLVISLFCFQQVLLPD